MRACRSLRWLLAFGWLGCVPQGEAGEDRSTTTGTAPVDSGSSDDALPGVEATSGATGSTFLSPPDVGQGAFACDIWAHDCPAGEKCMPWANDGGSSWTGTRCSPIAPSPAGIGEPCNVDGSGVSGLDDCDLASMCWDVDPETNTGTCVPLCVGDPSGPLCDDPGRHCVQAAGGALNICLPACNPLLQDCREGLGCYSGYGGFLCSPDASGGTGTLNEPCEFLNVCVPGLHCRGGPGVPCPSGAAACCRPYCDLGASETPCSVLEECVPWNEHDNVPPQLQDLGYCAFPDL